jgi:uncharacterized membrane protein
MDQLISTSITVRRFTGTAAAIGLLAACAASSSNAGIRPQGSDSQAVNRQVPCPPQVRLLPTRTATESSEATAINDNGWVAGSLATPRTKPRAVLWRDNGPPLDLGVNGSPVDINEDGDIAIRGFENGKGYLWKDGTLHRLRGTRSRSIVLVEALNDHGLVVGSVLAATASSARAAVWHKGTVRVLRQPSGGPRLGDYHGQDINNKGLVIGFRDRPEVYYGPSYWWRTDDRDGALSTGDTDRGYATHVDDRGRVVGFVGGRSEDDPIGPMIKWRSVRSQPKKFLNRGFYVFALHPDSGYVVGSRNSRRAFLAHLSNSRATLLPDPPALDGFDAYSTQAFDVATGQNTGARDGGVTVVGTAYFDSVARAVLWTCAQNYR